MELSGKLIFLDECGSTNDEVAALAREGAANGTSVAARVQTAGRGRRGHKWKSLDGNLYLSTLVLPNVPSAKLSGVSVAGVLGILRGISAWCTPGTVLLKWPNDIVSKGRKMGGILCELVDTPTGTGVVCGAGLDVKAPKLDEPASDEPTRLDAIGLEEVASTTLPQLEELAEAVSSGIVESVGAWADAVRDEDEATGPLASLTKEYCARLAYMGQRVVALSHEGLLLATGSLVGVDDWGRALVRDDDGNTQRFTPEQASLRPVEK